MNPHEELKKRIKENPELIGLENIVGVEEEVPCYGQNGNLVCQPDLIFEHENGKVVVEIKSSSHQRALAKLEKQLEKSQEFFKPYNGYYRYVGVYLEKNKIKYYQK